MELKDGIPCDHKGCLHHVKQPCEGCGRIGGVAKEYHLLHLLINGVHSNTFIEGRVGEWVIQHKGSKVVVVNSWRVSKSEYLSSLG